MAPHPDLLPLSALRADAESPPDVLIDALATVGFVTGERPHARHAMVDTPRPDAAFEPPGGRCVRTVRRSGSGSDLWAGEGWTLHVERHGDSSVTLWVCATTADLAESILSAVTADCCDADREPDENVTVQLWHATCRGVRSRRRSISCPTWDDIRRGYGAGPARALDRLNGLTPPLLAGRLLLLHGAPGTGKTTALRAMARSWRPWCELHVVLDPERLFASPSYLMDLVLGDDDERNGRWRCILLEDCDELVRAGAKEGVGQALGRLLNLTDGLLGQGLDVIVAITTNEPLHVLHPAVTRPGRCLAEIEVTRLTRAEAVTWLGTADGVGPDGATLAELHALRSTLGPIEARAQPAEVGQYL